MKGSILMTVVGLVVGFLACYLVSSSSTGSDNVAYTQQASDMPAVNSPQDVDSNDVPKDPPKNSHAVTRKNQTPSQTDFEDLAACTREVERLAKTVEHLTLEKSKREQDQEHEIGKPLPFPADLDPKYLEPALMKNLNAAYKEAGLDGDVSFVDCDEFPCIACANLGLDQGSEMNMSKMQEMFSKLSTSEVMSKYEDAQIHNSVFSSSEQSDGGSSQTLNNCQAIYPKQDDEQMKEALKKRLQWRMMNLAKTM